VPPYPHSFVNKTAACRGVQFRSCDKTLVRAFSRRFGGLSQLLTEKALNTRTLVSTSGFELSSSVGVLPKRERRRDETVSRQIGSVFILSNSFW